MLLPFHIHTHKRKEELQGFIFIFIQIKNDYKNTEKKYIIVKKTF